MFHRKSSSSPMTSDRRRTSWADRGANGGGGGGSNDGDGGHRQSQEEDGTGGGTWTTPTTATATSKSTTTTVGAAGASASAVRMGHGDDPIGDKDNEQQQQQQDDDDGRRKKDKYHLPSSLSSPLSLRRRRSVLFWNLMLGVGFVVVVVWSTRYSSMMMEIPKQQHATTPTTPTTTTTTEEKSTTTVSTTTKTMTTPSSIAKKTTNSQSTTLDKNGDDKVVDDDGGGDDVPTSNKEEPRQAALHKQQLESLLVDDDNTVKKTPHPEKCAIWTAPSSLQPFPGFGIFTTQAIQKEQSILQSPDAVAVALRDMRRRKSMPLFQQRRHMWQRTFGNYVWASGVPDHGRYDWPYDMNDFQPGFGSLPNHHCVLQSLAHEPVAPDTHVEDGTSHNNQNEDDEDDDDDDNNNNNKKNPPPIPYHVPYHDALLEQTSPGLGAFSYSLGRDFYAMRNLQAGDEIFLNYGACSRDPTKSHKNFDWSDKIFMPADFRVASLIVQRHEPFGEQEEGGTMTMRRKVNETEIDGGGGPLQRRRLGRGRPGQGRPWPQPDNFVEYFKKVYNEMDEEEKNGARRKFVLNILHQHSDPERRQRLLERMEAFRKLPISKMMKLITKVKNKSKEQLYQQKFGFEMAKSVTTPRTPDWIRQNGVCLEHLVPKPSTVVDAGWGGFAQFGVFKGDIVVPAPVLHIVDRNILKLYERGRDGDENHAINVTANPEKYQRGTGVLLNYCMGHSQSTLVFCPLTSALLLNHCSPRMPKESGSSYCPDGPNAEIRWSSWWDPNSVEWRNKTLDDIDDATGRLLSYEIVATRDISPDEEVFLDYGEVWEAAWLDHVRQWQPPVRPKNWLSAKEANELKGPIPSFLVSGDLRKTVDHPYLFAGCQYHSQPTVDLLGNYAQPNANWTALTDAGILRLYAGPSDDYKYETERGYTDHDEYSHWPCSILREEVEEGMYTVRIHQSPLKSNRVMQTAWASNNVPRILTGYSQTNIHWFVRPDATDQYSIPNVFRQPVGLPDHLFPEQWRNLA